MLAVLFSVMLVASENAATTVPEAPAATANQASEAPDPDKKICKRQQVTGQIQGTKRVCMTADKWKQVQEADQRRR